MSYLTEQGLYFFLGRSDKPKALPFQKWVYGEVLPTIRKTGKYIATEILENTGIFLFEGALVHIAMFNGQLLFASYDIFRALGYKSPKDKVRYHSSGEVRYYPFQTAYGIHGHRVMTEPDLRQAIAKSSYPDKRKFEYWMFERTLPAFLNSLNLPTEENKTTNA